MNDEPVVPSEEEPLIGLLAWLAELEGHAKPLAGVKAEVTVIVPDRAVANSFQMGCGQETGPFLAFPGVLWWFTKAWQAAAAGPAGIALVANCPQPLAILLPSVWPRTMEAFADQCRTFGWMALNPFESAYFEALGQTNTPRQPITQATDLDQTQGVPLYFPEEVSWLSPLLQSPLVV
ncbi:MAG: hypothetical protein V2J55_15470 [Candidatus Competibacteraceae bacterium]|jgi:hypothetical protein|nr:hypothetical protein [Candidatus Competibacteraceae bacterium]